MRRFRNPGMATAVLGTALLAAACASGPSPVEVDLAEAEPRVAEQITKLLAAARAEPAAPEGHAALGMAYETNGFADPARQCYEQAVELDPIEPRYTYYLAQIEASLGDVEAAADQMRRTLELAPGRVSAQLFLGNWLLDLGRDDEAGEIFAGVLRSEPSNAAATSGLARAFLGLGEPRKAIALLEPAMQTAEPDPHLLRLLGQAYGDAGEAERARLAAARAGGGRPPVWSDPWDERKREYRVAFSARMSEAEMLLSEERYPEALALLEELRAERPDERALLNNLAVAYRRAGMEEQSFEVLQDGLNRYPDYYPFHLNISVAYELREDQESALRHLRQAAEINPTQGAIHERLGNLLIGMQRRDEALEAYETALSYQGDQPWLLTNIALLRAELGHWEQAVDRAERALAAEPEIVAAWIILGRVKAEIGSFEDAQTALERAAQLAPNHPGLATAQQQLDKLRSGG